MSHSETTCWTLIEAAAEGEKAAWSEFVRRYRPIIRAYLAARWKRSALREQVDDGVQEVFLECLKGKGPLHRADAQRASSFKAYLYGIVRNIARRMEEHSRAWQRESSSELKSVPANDTSLNTVFDRAWARTLLKQAADVQAQNAAAQGAVAQRRVELLKLRFTENRPIREIAELWGLDPSYLHRQYALAREEFQEALRQVVLFHHPQSARQLDRKCQELLAALRR
jgi:RNA polymerase sigma-70 factor (ECF subfamily)